MNEQKAVSDKLNEVLRGERSAVETYQQALTKSGDDPKISNLTPLKKDHERAVEILTKKVLEVGGEPSTDSGAWGTWAQTVLGAAQIFGDQSALKALKEGEEHGLKLYKNLLEETDDEFKIVIQNQLMPQQEKHIQAINQLMNASA